MRLFQFLAVGFALGMLVASVLNLVRMRERPLASAFWVLLWASAAATIMVPDATTRVARAVGIQRGADLLIYCTALGLCVVAFLVYSKVRQLSREITLLTREVAILESEAARRPDRVPARLDR